MRLLAGLGQTSQEHLYHESAEGPRVVRGWGGSFQAFFRGELFDEPVGRNVDSSAEFLFIANLHKETLMILIMGSG